MFWGSLGLKVKLDNQTINKTKKALHSVNLIKKYFTKLELKTLITLNVYSVMYYNCEIWLMPSLHTSLKSQLLAVSARSLKLCDSITDLRISFDKLHKIHKRATPKMMMEYRLALQLYKLFNLESPNCMVCRYMRTPLHKREGGNSIINFLKNELV